MPITLATCGPFLSAQDKCKLQLLEEYNIDHFFHNKQPPTTVNYICEVLITLALFPQLTTLDNCKIQL